MEIKLARNLLPSDVILYNGTWELVRLTQDDPNRCMGHFDFGVQFFIWLDNNRQIQTFENYPWIVK